jgi:hypothetical protein
MGVKIRSKLLCIWMMGLVLAKIPDRRIIDLKVSIEEKSD